MKQLIIAVVLILPFFLSFSQGIKISDLPENLTINNNGYIPVVVLVNGVQVTKKISISKISKVDSVYISGDTLYTLKNGVSKSYRLAKLDTLLNGTKPISSLPAVGYNPNTNCLSCWIDDVYHQSQVPGAGLTGGQVMELMTGGSSINYTVNWTATRQSATSTLATIVVGNASQTFTQPAQPGTVSGTQVVPVTRNVPNTFQNVVTTTDNKTATASTVFSFLPKRYFGLVNTQVPSDANIIAAGGELSASPVKTYVQTPPSGSQYLMYAYPTGEGDLTNIYINGDPAIQSMTLTKRTLTNASGYSQQYNIYISNNAFMANTSSTIAYDNY